MQKAITLREIKAIADRNPLSRREEYFYAPAVFAFFLLELFPEDIMCLYDTLKQEYILETRNIENALIVCNVKDNELFYVTPGGRAPLTRRHLKNL